MVKNRSDTIILKGMPFIKEDIALGDIKCGELVQYDNNGIRLNNISARRCVVAFAVENDVVGKGINDDYEADDLVRFACFCAGQEAQVRAVNGDLVRGDLLESAGDGKLRKLTGGGDPIACCLESKSIQSNDNLIKIEVL